MDKSSEESKASNPEEDKKEAYKKDIQKGIDSYTEFHVTSWAMILAYIVVFFLSMFFIKKNFNFSSPEIPSTILGGIAAVLVFKKLKPYWKK